MRRNQDGGALDGVHAALRIVFVPVHPDGWPIIGGAALASLLLGLLFGPLGWLGAAATAWCVYFFRDPDRVVPTRPGLVVSPADGKVDNVTQAPPPPELRLGDEPRTRVSIFLNIFDVHVQRVPVEGTVIKAVYHPGRFFNATLDKASEENERMAVAIDVGRERTLAVVQIAGLIARRIRCDLEEGDSVTTGERYGLIRFGSRVDVYLPVGVDALVAPGQSMIGGESVIADLRSDEPARGGEIR